MHHQNSHKCKYEKKVTHAEKESKNYRQRYRGKALKRKKRNIIHHIWENAHMHVRIHIPRSQK